MLSPLPGEIEADLDLALRIGAAAAQVALRRFEQGDLVISTKTDGSPVSDADVAAERCIRSMLEAARLGDAVIGEELGEQGTGPRRWIVDPIDGTAN